MQAYKITYTGSSEKFKNLNALVDASTSKNALIEFYKSNCIDNYFPEFTSAGDIYRIYDADGYCVFRSMFNRIWYDGGYFETELITGE